MGCPLDMAWDSRPSHVHGAHNYSKMCLEVLGLTIAFSVAATRSVAGSDEFDSAWCTTPKFSLSYPWVGAAGTEVGDGCSDKRDVGGAYPRNTRQCLTMDTVTRGRASLCLDTSY
jgi:hypothetical protein